MSGGTEHHPQGLCEASGQVAPGRHSAAFQAQLLPPPLPAGTYIAQRLCLVAPATCHSGAKKKRKKLMFRALL